MPRSCDTPGAQRPPLSAPRPSEEGAYTGRPHDLPGCRLVAGPASLPVRRLTLCKHGGAFVERAGPTSGESIQLDFRVDDVNDALKSLFVLDRRGGQVLGIRYDTRTDRTARVAESPLTLGRTRAPRPPPRPPRLGGPADCWQRHRAQGGPGTARRRRAS